MRTQLKEAFDLHMRYVEAEREDVGKLVEAVSRSDLTKLYMLYREDLRPKSAIRGYYDSSSSDDM